MDQNQITDLPLLNQENYENIFNVYKDENNRYYYNLLQSVVIPSNLPESFFTKYTVVYGDTLPYVSYKTLGDIHLWWVIANINKIIDPTKQLMPNDVLKIPTPSVLRSILNQI
jgi:LysM repeat protein